MELKLIENKFYKDDVIVTERFMDVTNVPLEVVHLFCIERGLNIDMRDNKVLMHLVTIEETI